MVDGKKLSARALVLLTATITIFLGFALTIGVLIWQFSKQQEEAAWNYLQEATKANASLVQSGMDLALNAARNLGYVALGMRSQSNGHNRDLLETVTQHMLAGNAALSALAVIFEPDVFDGKDKEYAGKDVRYTNRHYARWSHRNNDGKVITEALTDYDTPGTGDWFLGPREHQREVIIEPYPYTLNGVKVLLISIASPLMENGQFLGVAITDYELTALQKIVDAIKPYDGAGHAALFSAAGVYIAGPDKSLVGKSLENNKPLLDRIKAGKPWRSIDANGMMNLYLPILIGNSGTPWMLGVSVPRDVVMAESIKLRSLAILLTVIITAIVCGVVALTFTRKVLLPVGGEPAMAATIALTVAEGDLIHPIQVRPNDKSSIFYALAHMQAQLRSIIGQIAVISESIGHGVSEIATGNSDLSHRTEEQAASLEQTAASMEQLASTVKQNADNANQANQLAASASEVAVRGGEAVGEVVETMSAISASSNKISEIVSVIDGIAFQTNILALNAAVEAARAGEQGKGFAVVAVEVRTLAQRSANAAREIKQLIEDSVSKVNVGAAQVERAGATMQEIVTSVKRVTGIMGEIAAASDEQARGIDQVNQAVTQMEDATKQNAALVEQSAAAALSMRDQTANLNQVVTRFRINAR